ncbi:UDP-glucuronate 4-epimerase 3 [Sesamum angolense]|uniref:UDP-glucuronate 4-epimerase 3 n=1 Tax=Sesamum angolense TaxID=2727404 RepID=A0AAE2BL51_9LAMI|nr:UDP-glucuronate 4-epimerase 3 [Sesamum angolense]
MPSTACVFTRDSLFGLFLSSFFLLLFFFCSPPAASTAGKRRSLQNTAYSARARPGPNWEVKARNSARPQSKSGFTVLVTGAAGFVGTHVAMALKNRGDGVVGLDNFNNYYETGLKKARKSLLERRGVYIIEGDINDAALLGKLFEIVHFTHVMHLAAQAGVRYAMQNPNSYIHSNVNGFVSLLEACKNANPQPSIVWASSSSVYGLNSKVPFSEKDRTDQPASLYAATKKAGEEKHTLTIISTGFLSGDQDFEGADHATVARDFTYIDDVVKGCLAALDTAKKSTGSGGKKKGAAQLRIYNLGNTSPVPVGKLVSILEKLLKIKAKKKFLPMPRNGDVLFTHANISLARKELGYKPTTDLETGLKKFVKWYLSYYGAKKKSTW